MTSEVEGIHFVDMEVTSIEHFRFPLLSLARYPGNKSRVIVQGIVVSKLGKLYQRIMGLAPIYTKALLRR
mgnify:CR=1 FL=1